MGKIKRIAASVLVIIACGCSGTESNNDRYTGSYPQTSERYYKFELYELSGKAIKVPFTFTADTQGLEWKLDFINGEVITYNIISFDKNELLCNIKAKDNFGDIALLCINKVSDSKTLISIEYITGKNSVKMVYTARKI